MSTIDNYPAVDVLAQADNEAASRYVVDGKPLPPDLVRRIQVRADRIRQKTFRRVGEVDVDKMIRESRDES